MKLKYLSKILVPSTYAFLTFLALRKFIFRAGTLGHNWDWSIPSLPSQLRALYYSYSYLWSEYNFGDGRLWGDTCILFGKFIGLFGFLNIGGDFVSKALVFFVIVVSSYGMYKLILDLFENNYEDKYSFLQFGAFLGGFFYGFSPYLFCDFIGGGNTQFFTYAIFPFGFMFLRRYLIKGNFNYLFLSVAFLSFINFSFQRLFLLFVMMGLYIVFVLSLDKLIIKRLFYCAIFFLLINLYWVIPLMVEMKYSFSSVPIKELTYYDQNIKTSVPDLTQIFIGTGYFRPFFNVVITHKRLWVLSSYFSIILVFYSIIRFAKKREALFWFCLFLFSLIFSTGGKAPLGDVVMWCYQHITMMNLFRSPQHLIIVPTFCLSIMLAFGTYYVWEYYFQFRKKILSTFFFFCMFGMVLLWLHPWFIYGDLGSSYLKTNSTGGNFIDNYNLSPDYKAIDNILNQNLNPDYRMLPLPMTTSPYYLKTEYQSDGQGGDMFLMAMPVPSVTSDFINGLRKEVASVIEREILTEKRFNTFVNLIRLVSVKYILLRNDVIYSDDKRVWDIENIKSFLDRLISKNFIKKLFEGKHATLYELADTCPMLYIPSEVYKISGGFEIIAEIFNSTSIKDTSSPVFLYNNFDGNNKYISDIGLDAYFAHYFKDDSEGITNDLFSFDTEDGKYLLSTGIETIPYIQEKKEWGWRHDFKEEFLDTWLINSVNTKWYRDKYYAKGLKLFLLFDGSDKEDEYLQMKYDKLYVDLKEYPYFDLRYSVQSPSVQIIEVVLGLDFDNDRITDAYTRGVYAHNSFCIKSDFTRNFYNIAIGLFPDKENYKVTSIELYPHKFWKTDCTTTGAERYYRFYMDSIGFYKTGAENIPYFKKVRNKFDIQGLDESLKFDVTKSGNSMCLVLPINGIEIKKFFNLKFRYKLSKLVRDVEITIYIKDKRGGPDSIKKISLGHLLLFQDKEGEYNYNLLNKLNSKGYFKNRNYIITKFEFKFIMNSSAKTNNVRITDLIDLKRFQIYKELHIPKKGFVFRNHILEIDGKKLLFNKDDFNGKCEKEDCVFQNVVNLKKGKHNIRNVFLDDPNLKCKWAMLSPLSDRNKKKNERPNIRYIKLNPCKYEVYLDNVRSSFLLVFGQTYSPAWNAYVIEDNKRALLKKHFVANGYANGWEVDEISRNESTILIEYVPQKWLVVCSVISGCGFVGMFIVVIFFSRGKK
jgi:hypothetical protein